MRQDFCEFGNLEENLVQNTLPPFKSLFAAGRDICKGLARTQC